MFHSFKPNRLFPVLVRCPRSHSSSMSSNRRSILNRIVESVIGKSCPICLRHVEVPEAAVVIPCMHTYCIRCIRRWSNLRRKCPLCNTDFDSWFYRINLASGKFQKEKLLLPVEEKRSDSALRDGEVFRGQRTHFFHQRRALIRSREQLRNVRFPTRVLPRQRSFGHEDQEHPDAIGERVKQWRASVYEQRLQAVPLPSKTLLDQQLERHNDAKQEILQKVEPWIKRELQAVLGDPDPSVIVHVASSVFISNCEKKHGGLQEQAGFEDDFLAPLRPFLHELADMFWHELRCFAESSFTMETYDTVVEYKALN